MNSIDYISIKDAAVILNVSLPTMYQIANRKGFPASRIGRGYRINKSKFTEWLDNGGFAV